MTWIESALADVRPATRALARRPVFTLTATVTLALGIATATAMFTLVDGILLRPLPYPRADRLVEVMQSYPEKGLDRWTLSQENAAMYGRVRAFASFAAHTRTGVTLTDNGQAERLIAQVVTGDLFPLLRVRPLVGRIIERQDDRPGYDNVTVLSYGFWQSHFGGAASAVGTTIHVGGQPIKIVGVMPAWFSFPTPDVQLYLPLGLDPSSAHPNFLVGLARLRDGPTVSEASREATLVMQEWARRSPGTSVVDPSRTRMRVLVTPLRTAITGNVARPLLVLQGAVLFILLIAVANVGTLLGARGVARERELAVRSALGASRGRLVIQLLVESLVLAAVGGLVGVLMALGIVRTVSHSVLVSVPRLEEVTISWRVLTFALGVTAVSGFAFGSIPAFTFNARGLRAALAGQRSSSGTATRTVNRTLIVVQVTLSFVLVIAAGLMVKSFRRLVATDLGFDPAQVVSVTMPLPGARYGGNLSRSLAFVDEVVSTVSRQPGVRSAAVMFPTLYVNDVNSDGFLVEGQSAPTTTAPQTVQYSVSPGLFRTLQIPLLAGRDFTATDRADAAPVVIVDAALAERYWIPATSSVGKRIRMTGDNTWRRIVGVVGSIRDESVSQRSRPHTYFPYAQYGGSRPALVVRSSSANSVTMVDAVRRAIAAVDPGVPIDNAHPVTAAIASSLSARRLTELLLIGFAALAVLLAACGLYGVMSLYVAHRKREFGIRAAIGARPSTLVAVVVREGFGLVALGVTVGFVLSFFVTRSLQLLLYEVTPSDPGVYAMVGGILLGIAGGACYLPARRAAKADPITALRAE